jgi:hypothetical protein
VPASPEIVPSWPPAPPEDPPTVATPLPAP